MSPKKGSFVCTIFSFLSLSYSPAHALPKTPGLRNLRGRLAQSTNLHHTLARRQDTNDIGCAPASAINIQAPSVNIWNDLSEEETVDVTKWLFDQKDLNLTVSENATEWSNTVLLVELMQPNKTEALAYMDGEGAPPLRYAHVLLNLRLTDEPVYADILVGPLPIKNGTTAWQPLEYPFTRKSGGHVRNLDADIEAVFSEFVYGTSASISDITMDLWGGTALGRDNDSMVIFGTDPPYQEPDNEKVSVWYTFWNTPTENFDSLTLHPLGLFFKGDITGRDPAQWKVEGWFYNGIFYSSTEEFREAYWSDGFEKLPPNEFGEWASTNHHGPAFEEDYAAPPKSVAPSGPRYKVDEQAKYVEWMGFSFYIGFSRDTGMALYDVRYEGQRILYELGLQEALAHYASQDPMLSGVSYLDSYYGFGPYAFQLIPGYDCPEHATFLNTSFYTAETTHTHIDSICMFEFDASYPMSRHTSSSYVTVTKNVYFTIRTVCTVGNYDYEFSYEFYMDGSMKVIVRASGYIQSAYFANNQKYGYQINDQLSGSMHDHVLHYKADFDILGTANTMEMTTFTPTTETYPWADKPRNTMKLKREILKSEDDSQLFWAPNGATQFIVVNTDSANRYREYRGYRILPAEGTSHLTVLNSTNLGNSANWASHDLAVTRRKDTEPRSAHAYNNQDVHNPPVDFSAFFDGESLEQEDLVVWFNLGMHHVPHTGDLPNTVFTTAHSAVHFMPVNYFAGDVSRRSLATVKIGYGGGEESEVETFGQCGWDGEDARLKEYKGDVVVRKFPYGEWLASSLKVPLLTLDLDPNNPWYETIVVG